jgi:hypothetical protein
MNQKTINIIYRIVIIVLLGFVIYFAVEKKLEPVAQQPSPISTQTKIPAPLNPMGNPIVTEPADLQPSPASSQETNPASIETTSKSTDSEPKTDTSLQIQFDACGKVNKYKNESWYPDFINSLQKNHILVDDTILNSDSCLSLDKTIFLMLISEPDWCGKNFSIYKYYISDYYLERAMIDIKGVKGCIMWPGGFGKREGNVIKLQGHGGDGGCGSDDYFNYDIIENKLELKQSCGQCEGEETETCTNY